MIFHTTAGLKTDETELDEDPGNDPDNVAGDELPEQALKAVGVEPGDKHHGSVQSLIAGQKDIEVASVSLTAEQVLVRRSPVRQVGPFPGSYRALALHDRAIDAAEIRI